MVDYGDLAETQEAWQVWEPGEQPEEGVPEEGPPPEVMAAGESGHDPSFLTAGEGFSFFWGEYNNGGAHADTYHSQVTLKDPDGNVVFDELVECSPLQNAESAQRSIEVPGQPKGTGYTAEIYLDVDHHTEWSEGYNYIYLNVIVYEE